MDFRFSLPLTPWSEVADQQVSGLFYSPVTLTSKLAGCQMETNTFGMFGARCVFRFSSVTYPLMAGET